MKKIPLTKGAFATVDDEDYEVLSSMKWCIDSDGYAKRRIRHPLGTHRQCDERMHRRILGLSYGDKSLVDHKNGDRLDNRRENLRVCDPLENTLNRKRSSRNTSGLKGVAWYGPAKKWRARIVIDGKQRHLGYFNTKEDAYAAYCANAKQYYGEFANFGDLAQDESRIA